MEGQMSIFDFPQWLPSDLKDEVNTSRILEHDISRGSGFENGKKRIYKFFKANQDIGERAMFLKKEYGDGGRTGSLKGVDYFQSHDAKGINIRGKNFEISASWKKVAKVIEDLMMAGKYYEEKICVHSKHECNKEDLFAVAEELDEVECPRICCRLCDEKMCGARCNGAD